MRHIRMEVLFGQDFSTLCSLLCFWCLELCLAHSTSSMNVCCSHPSLGPRDREGYWTCCPSPVAIDMSPQKHECGPQDGQVDLPIFTGPLTRPWCWARPCAVHKRHQPPGSRPWEVTPASSPFRTPTAGSLQSWDRRVRPRLV